MNTTWYHLCGIKKKIKPETVERWLPEAEGYGKRGGIGKVNKFSSHKGPEMTSENDLLFI